MFSGPLLCFCSARDNTYLKVGLEEALGQIRQSISLQQRRQENAVVVVVDVFVVAVSRKLQLLLLLLEQQADQGVGVPADGGDGEIPLQARLEDGLVEAPIRAVGADDIVACVLRNDAVGDLLLVAALVVLGVFVPEDLGDEGGAGDEDVPAGCEEDLDGAVLLQGAGEVLFVQVDLVEVVPEQRQQSDVEGDGRDVLREVPRREDEESRREKIEEKK